MGVERYRRLTWLHICANRSETIERAEQSRGKGRGKGKYTHAHARAIALSDDVNLSTSCRALMTRTRGSNVGKCNISKFNSIGLPLFSLCLSLSLSL